MNPSQVAGIAAVYIVGLVVVARYTYEHPADEEKEWSREAQIGGSIATGFFWPIELAMIALVAPVVGFFVSIYRALRWATLGPSGRRQIRQERIERLESELGIRPLPSSKDGWFGRCPSCLEFVVVYEDRVEKAKSPTGEVGDHA